VTSASQLGLWTAEEPVKAHAENIQAEPEPAASHDRWCVCEPCRCVRIEEARATIARESLNPITQAQLKIPRRPNNPRAWTRTDYRRCARWLELEASRGYPSSARTQNYATNQRWLAEIAAEHGPGSALELIERAGAKVRMNDDGLLIPVEGSAGSKEPT
jgi:hypothetical protein